MAGRHGAGVPSPAVLSLLALSGAPAGAGAAPPAPICLGSGSSRRRSCLCLELLSLPCPALAALPESRAPLGFLLGARGCSKVPDQFPPASCSSPRAQGWDPGGGRGAALCMALWPAWGRAAWSWARAGNAGDDPVLTLSERAGSFCTTVGCWGCGGECRLPLLREDRSQMPPCWWLRSPDLCGAEL